MYKVHVGYKVELITTLPSTVAYKYYTFITVSRCWANRLGPWESSAQEAQLSQRDCAMLCVVEYFAKSLRITQKSFEMTPLTRACVGHYSIVTIYLYRTVYETFSVK